MSVHAYSYVGEGVYMTNYKGDFSSEIKFGFLVSSCNTHYLASYGTYTCQKWGKTFPAARHPLIHASHCLMLVVFTSVLALALRAPLDTFLFTRENEIPETLFLVRRTTASLRAQKNTNPPNLCKRDIGKKILMRFWIHLLSAHSATETELVLTLHALRVRCPHKRAETAIRRPRSW